MCFILHDNMENENPCEYPFTDWLGDHHLLVYYRNYTPGIYPVEPNVQLFRPYGFNVSIPIDKYPILVRIEFDGNVNKPIVNHTYEETQYNISGLFKRHFKKYGYWEFLDWESELKVGDILYYWLSVIIEPPINDSYKIIAIKTRNEYAELITEAHMKNSTRIK